MYPHFLLRDKWSSIIFGKQVSLCSLVLLQCKQQQNEGNNIEKRNRSDFISTGVFPFAVNQFLVINCTSILILAWQNTPTSKWHCYKFSINQTLLPLRLCFLLRNRVQHSNRSTITVEMLLIQDT